MTKKFQFVNDSYENFSILGTNEITNCMCSIHINNEYVINLTLFQAICLSKKVAEDLLNDLTKTDFYFDINFNGIINNDFIQKIHDVILMKEISLENSQEILNFALFGKSTKNNSFIKPYTEEINKLQEDINQDNVYHILEHKIYFSNQQFQCDKEISFLAKHFSEQKEKLIQLSENQAYLIIIESIITHKELTLINEDELLEFVLKLSQNNSQYESLFEHVFLEYCSVSSVEAFINYIQESSFHSYTSNSIINCIKRRLLQEKLPIFKQPENRIYHKAIRESKVFNDNNPLTGILRTENNNGNVKMNYSSQNSNDDIYSIITGSVTGFFETK